MLQEEPLLQEAYINSIQSQWQRGYKCWRFFFLRSNRIVTHKENSVFIWDNDYGFSSCAGKKSSACPLEPEEPQCVKYATEHSCRIRLRAGTLPGITLFLGSFFLYPLPVSPENISLIYNLYVSPYLRLCFTGAWPKNRWVHTSQMVR